MEKEEKIWTFEIINYAALVLFYYSIIILGGIYPQDSRGVNNPNNPPYGRHWGSFK